MSKRGGLKRIADRLTRNVSKALFAGGEAIAVEAQVSITGGSKTGRVYTHEFVTINGRVVPIEKRASPHQASAPGEAPADDLGGLAANVEVAQLAPLKVEVSSNAQYSQHLEFGTSKVAPRPFMRPAADAKRKEITKLVRDAVNHSIKQEGS